MTITEKANYLRIAAFMIDEDMTTEKAELIIKLYQGILRKKGDFSQEDAITILQKVRKKYLKPEIPVIYADSEVISNPDIPYPKFA